MTELNAHPRHGIFTSSELTKSLENIKRSGFPARRSASCDITSCLWTICGVQQLQQV